MARRTVLISPGASPGGVVSVFGRVGAVAAQAGDYGVAQVTGAAPLASPALTGLPTAPTAAGGTNTTQLATTAFVQAAVAGVVVPVSSVFGRTGAVAATAGDYSVAQVTGAAPLASPAFTGTPTAPTPAPGDNSTTLATTAFVTAALGPQLQSVVVTLTNAQILALPTVFPQIVAAPGAGKMLIPITCVVTCDATAGIYTNINAAAIFCLQYGSSGAGLNASQTVFQGISTKLTKLIATASKNITILNEVGQTSAASGNFLEAITPSVTTVFDNLSLNLSISNGGSGNLTGGNTANSMKVTVYYLIVSW